MINNISTNAAGIELLKEYEGFESKIYKDAAGIPTIGYGHVVLGGRGLWR